VYEEFSSLRQCRMSRRDIVSQMFTKESRKTLASQISFWEGVLAVMKEATALKTFASLEFFREF